MKKSLKKKMYEKLIGDNKRTNYKELLVKRMGRKAYAFCKTCEVDVLMGEIYDRNLQYNL